jgi:hypothetical protein
MGKLSDFMERINRRKKAQKEYEDNQRVVNNAEQKKLSHTERELMKVLKEEKEQLMKETLYWENEKRKAKEKLKAREFMQFSPGLFQNDSMLKQKNDFLRGGNF